jgi:hypothetical protein
MKNSAAAESSQTLRIGDLDSGSSDGWLSRLTPWNPGGVDAVGRRWTSRQ